MSKESAFRVKRIYEDASDDDGYRVLVDRLWPRGVSKERAHLDEWMKGIAPSTELRKWFNHDKEKFDEFKTRYFEELEKKEEPVNALLEKGKSGLVTLLYAAKDQEHNHALVLKEYLKKET